jgi:hypothetical protein
VLVRTGSWKLGWTCTAIMLSSEVWSSI